MIFLCRIDGIPDNYDVNCIIFYIVHTASLSHHVVLGLQIGNHAKPLLITSPPLSRRVQQTNGPLYFKPCNHSPFPNSGKLYQLFQYILVLTMTDSFIPLASDAIYWREQLFETHVRHGTRS